MSWEKEIENDLKWREEELAALRFAVSQSVVGGVAHKALLRALWTMLYAHYEGFCLYALRVFLGEVRRSGVARDECKESLVLFSLESLFRKIRKGTPSTPDFHAFCKAEFPALMAAAIDFETGKDGEFVVAGRSNLYASDLLTHCAAMCLAETCIDANKSKLGLLVTRRNAIAHGEEEVVKDLAEYKPYEDAAIEAMHDIAVAVVDALDCRTYLKPEFQPPLFTI